MHRTPDALCYACGYHVNAASELDGEAKPAPEDFTVCIDCGAIMQFDAALRPVRPPLGVLEALRLTEPEVHSRLERASALARRLSTGGKASSPAAGRRPG